MNMSIEESHLIAMRGELQNIFEGVQLEDEEEEELEEDAEV